MTLKKGLTYTTTKIKDNCLNTTKSLNKPKLNLLKELCAKREVLVNRGYSEIISEEQFRRLLRILNP